MPINYKKYDENGNVLLTSNTFYINGFIVLLKVTTVSNKFSLLSATAPNLVLYTGASYIFDTTGFFNTEHQFRISSTPDGIWNGGSVHPEMEIYDNFILFNPKTSGTFYYYCENHPNMGGVIKVENQSVNQLLQQKPSYVNENLLTGDISTLLSGGIYL